MAKSVIPEKNIRSSRGWPQTPLTVNWDCGIGHSVCVWANVCVCLYCREQVISLSNIDGSCVTNIKKFQLQFFYDTYFLFIIALFSKTQNPIVLGPVMKAQILKSTWANLRLAYSDWNVYSFLNDLCLINFRWNSIEKYIWKWTNLKRIRSLRVQQKSQGAWYSLAKREARTLSRTSTGE